MKMIHGIPVYGDPQFNAVEQMEHLIAPSAAYVALMADHHLGYSMPIGGVAAYRDMVSPSGVGYDIACGNKAVRLDADPMFTRSTIKDIMDQLVETVSFGVGRSNNAKVDSEVLDRKGQYSDAWDIVGDISKASNRGRNALYDMAAAQLGTVGSGNHYVDIFVSGSNQVWVGVHFGSRGLGHKIATHFIKAGGGADGINSPPVLLADDSELGMQYLRCMELAGAYAYAGRDWVCEAVANIIGGNIVEEVHNHHNFAWKETHFGEDLWVVRKGATPAGPGQKGFIGGSMAEPAHIVQGVAGDESAQAMYSTVHGAGRIMSRGEAKGKVHRKTGEVKREGKVSQKMMHDWVRDAKVELRGAGVDESPDCYKRLEEVLAYHANTIEVLVDLYPIGVAMAGADIFDPYKD